MTDETHNLFDDDLQQLFAGVHPAVGFEDRLVNAVRVQRRWSIPQQIRQAAIAAAAVLVVGSVGYFGNRAITGDIRFAKLTENTTMDSPDIATSRAIQDVVNGLSPDGSRGGIVSSQAEYGFRSQDKYTEQLKNGQPGLDQNGDGIININTASAATLDGLPSHGKVAFDEQPKQKLVAGLVRDAKDYAADGKYDEALAVVKHINEVDPANNYPGIVSQFFSDKAAAAQKSREYSERFDTEFTKTFASAEPQKKGQPPLSSASNGPMSANVLQEQLSLDDGRSRHDPDLARDHEYFTGGRAVVLEPLKQKSFVFKPSEIVSVSGKIGAINKSLPSGGKDDVQILDRFEGGTAITAYAPTPTPSGRATQIEDLKDAKMPLTSEAQASFDPEVFRKASIAANPVTAAIPALSTVEPPPGPADEAKRGQPPLIEKAEDSVLLAPEQSKLAEAAHTANGAGATTAPVIIDTRKIIRSGTMEFEVDRFDSAQANITKIVSEMGGFVGATDSTKLPNGKVRGTISLRIPPERLDALVLSLRALGDLKSQQITAADITKEYTDLQSELTADRAMQDRLLELIHNGKGSVKDLLAAENELGTWRTKIEKAEGELRYDDSLVAMSTLSITLSERDIQTPATAIETETADLGIEAEDVEKARNTAMKAIDDAKGRIIAAELKRYDAGQLAAQITADVPPDSAGALIDQLKLLGKVARLEVRRQQTTSDGSPTVTVTARLKTERKPTRLLISIYNLANVAPRRTTNISLAATDVEAAFNALITETRTDGGRVVTSNLDRGDPVKATGSVVLELPPAKLDAAMTALRATGDVLKLSLTENADTQNSTEAKQGLTVQLVSLASVPAREAVQQAIAAVDVPATYQTILNAAAGANARTVNAQLNEQDRHNITADVQLELQRSQLSAFDKVLADSGDTISRTSTRAADSEGTVDSKVELKLSISSADHLAPRETTKLQSEVPDVDKAAGDAQAIAVSLGGRVIDATVTRDRGKDLAHIALDIPLGKAPEALRQIRSMGTLRGIDASRDTNAPTGPLAHAQIFIEFATGDALVTEDTGPWASIRHGLSTSINALLWSLQWVVVGVCLIGPFALVGWVATRIGRRSRIRV